MASGGGAGQDWSRPREAGTAFAGRVVRALRARIGPRARPPCLDYAGSQLRRLWDYAALAMATRELLGHRTLQDVHAFGEHPA